MRLWLDDVRNPDELGLVGFTWVKTVEEAIALLNMGAGGIRLARSRSPRGPLPRRRQGPDWPTPAPTMWFAVTEVNNVWSILANTLRFERTRLRDTRRSTLWPFQRVLNYHEVATLNFKEIAEAHIAGNNSDAFELFTRDFLDLAGFKIEEQPSRGPDGGKDLIVEEIRKGVGGETDIRWLVSCKHKAHSGKSVGADEEPSILDRVQGKNCRGFMGFYSTLPSPPLASRLKELKGRIEVKWYDCAQIEGILLGSEPGILLAKRYFPLWIAIWQAEHPKPRSLWPDPERLLCEHCSKDLLEEILKDGPGRSIVTFWRSSSSESHSAQIDEVC